MGLEEIRDRVVEEFEYFISFEWFGDTIEFFSGLSFDISEFSIMGLIGGVIAVGLTKMTLVKLDYINNLEPFARIFNYGIYYLFAFFFTYIMVKRVFEI